MPLTDTQTVLLHQACLTFTHNHLYLCSHASTAGIGTWAGAVEWQHATAISKRKLATDGASVSFHLHTGIFNATLLQQVVRAHLKLMPFPSHTLHPVLDNAF